VRTFSRLPVLCSSAVGDDSNPDAEQSPDDEEFHLPFHQVEVDERRVGQFRFTNIWPSAAAARLGRMHSSTLNISATVLQTSAFSGLGVKQMLLYGFIHPLGGPKPKRTVLIPDTLDRVDLPSSRFNVLLDA